MASSTIVSVGQSNSAESVREFGDIGRRLTSTIQRHEKNIVEELGGILNASSPLMSIPKPVRDQFKRWDVHLRTPEERQAAKEIKSKIIEMYNENTNYIETKTRTNIDKVQIELALKAISKALNGIQQILSSQ